MYDYRAPRKKNGAAHHRRVSSASPRQRLVAAHHRRVHQPVRSSARTPRQPFQWPSAASWFIGLVLLAVAGLITYFLIFKTVLPLIVPVTKEEVIAISAGWTEPSNQTVTFIRISPASRQLVIVQGVPPTPKLDQPVPLSWVIGMPIDRQLVASRSLGGADRKSVEQLFWERLSMKAISGTDPRTALGWWAFSRSLSNAQITTYTVEDGDWDRARRLLTTSRDTTHCPIALVNTTGVAGVATQLSRLIEPAGFFVVKVTDDQEVLAETKVLYDQTQPECSEDAFRLNTFKTQPLEAQAAEGIVAQYRAPIVIKIGQDLGTLLQAWSQADSQ